MKFQTVGELHSLQPFVVPAECDYNGIHEDTTSSFEKNKEKRERRGTACGFLTVVLLVFLTCLPVSSVGR